jgi:hypothetical protein
MDQSPGQIEALSIPSVTIVGDSHGECSSAARQNLRKNNLTRINHKVSVITSLTTRDNRVVFVAKCAGARLAPPAA